jgi:hypothetical protein
MSQDDDLYALKLCISLDHFTDAMLDRDAAARLKLKLLNDPDLSTPQIQRHLKRIIAEIKADIRRVTIASDQGDGETDQWRDTNCETPSQW